MTDDEAVDRLARFFFRLAKWLISGVFVGVFLFLRYLFTHHRTIFWALLGVVGVVAVFYFGIYTLPQTNSVPVQTLPTSAQVAQQPTHASAPTDAQMTQSPNKTTIRPTQTTIPRWQPVIIDDSDSEFVVEGPASGWRIASYGYNGSTHWTYCTDAGISNWAKWIPHLPLRGNYEVYVHVPEHNAGTKQATYRILFCPLRSERKGGGN